MSSITSTESKLSNTGICRFGFISPKALQNLADYKYVSSCAGYLDCEIMNPFWEQCLESIPKTIAPNVITVASLTSVVIAHWLMQYYVPNLGEAAPRFVYLLCAVCIFMYQTLDALDGKQARRTKSSSPLGQLFDHGCDAICSVLISLILAAMLQAGISELTLVILFLNIVPFFLSNWEESCTGKMRFGVLGVTEGQDLVIVLLLLTSLFGPGMWFVRMPFFVISVREFLLICALVGVGYQSCSSYLAVKEYQEQQIDLLTNKTISTCSIDQLKTAVRTHREQGQALEQFIVFIILSTGWTLLLLYLDPEQSILVQYPRFVFGIIGLIFVLNVTQIIVGHVTQEVLNDTRDVVYQVLPLIILFAFVPFPSWINTTVVGLFAIAVTSFYVTFVYLTIRQITTFLGIDCFTIKRTNSTDSASDNKNQ